MQVLHLRQLPGEFLNLDYFSKLLQTVGILNDYLKTCVISPKNLYMKLISGLRRLDEMLCYDAAYFQSEQLAYFLILFN